jgi:hypothetical protein
MSSTPTSESAPFTNSDSQHFSDECLAIDAVAPGRLGFTIALRDRCRSYVKRLTVFAVI